jgi:hypothetical protein
MTQAFVQGFLLVLASPGERRGSCRRFLHRAPSASVETQKLPAFANVSPGALHSVERPGIRSRPLPDGRRARAGRMETGRKPRVEDPPAFIAGH